jgi:4-azaleucine resistance transporter AzlC
MSLLVFAGASQFMALEMLALGTGAVEIVLSTFIVNIRHLLMSMSINERAAREPKPIKGLYAFFITDEVFAVAAAGEREVGSGYLFGLGLMAYLGWTINTAVGYLAGAVLPLTLQEGMSVALYAMFIGLLIPSVKRHRKALYLAGGAGLLNALFVRFLPTGWAIIAAAAAAVLVTESIEHRLERRRSPAGGERGGRDE